jgi:hypothetical protein
MAPALMLLLAGFASAEVRDLSVDPLASTERWQVGGNRINYTLGSSTLQAVSEPKREGFDRCLRLVGDFRDAQRYYLSAYHTGPAIRGVCQQVSVWVMGDGSGRRLQMEIEDARGRWFRRNVGQLDGTDWQQLTVPVGDGEGWSPLLRRGEEKLPILHPINLRQISVLSKPDAEPLCTLYLSDLRATCDVVAADYVDATLKTGKPANLFDLGEPVTPSAELTDAADQRVEGRLRATLTDSLGREGTVDLGAVSIAPDGRLACDFDHPTDRQGAYTVRLILTTSERERVWQTHLAVLRPLPERPADPNSRFGSMFNIGGFSAEQMPTVWRLNRDGGFRWTRVGFGWGEINPAPGVWAWDGPTRIDGPVGKAADLGGQPYRLAHRPILNCPDAVTIAFWARGTQSTGNWQFPLMKWGPGDRNYGVYFHRDNGRFTFSASYEKMPAGSWHDIGCDFSAWDNQWHHYAATYSAAEGEVDLYVDGALNASVACDGGKLRTNKDDLTLGAGCPAPLDEMVIYNRALAANEVAQLAAKAAPPKEGLIAYWPFEGTGAKLADASGHGLDIESGEPSGAREARVALARGIKTLGLLGFAPKWASTAPDGAERPWVYKPKLDAWAEFVEQTTRHYADLVQHWEIWNEPNITVFWEPTPDPKEFMDVLRVGYEAAKRGNPNCTVLMPGLAGPTENGWGMDFLDELLKQGAARYCDAVSIHPYRQSTPEESDLVGELQHIADLAEANGGRRPIWYTENCWTTQIPGGSTEERQALMLPRCYVLSLGTGLVDKLLWFRLHDAGSDRFYSEHNYGICYEDLTPKPAYFAHQTVATLLEGAKPEGEWDVGSRCLARVFRTPTERLAALWCPNGTASASVFVGRSRVRVTDIMGNSEEQETQEGVLIVSPTESLVYLRDLPDDAEGRGAPIELRQPMLVRGATGNLAVRLRNPFREAKLLSVRLQPAEGLTLGTTAKELQVPGNQTREADFGVTVPADARPGWHDLTAEVRVAGRGHTEQGRLGVRAAATDAGPVGYWKLDEGQGAVIHDESPFHNHGTVDQPHWVEGKHGTALQFDGQHIAQIPDAPSLNLPDEVTLAFWLKVTGETGTWQFPVTKYLNENVRRNYGIYLHNEKLYPCFSASFERGGYLHTDIGSNVPVNDGQWHHIAASYSMFEGRARVYVDGKPAVDRPFDEGRMLFAATPLRFGIGTLGAIDEVVVYPRALTAEEVSALPE